MKVVRGSEGPNTWPGSRGRSTDFQQEKEEISDSEVPRMRKQTQGAREELSLTQDAGPPGLELLESSIQGLSLLEPVGASPVGERAQRWGEKKQF